MGHHPDWSTDVIILILSPDENTTRLQELTAGTYISICGGIERPGYWLGGQLIVEI